MAETKWRNASSPSYNLSTIYPAIATQWHPTLNGELLPSDFAPKSGRRAWWVCNLCSHVWSATIAQRTYYDTWCPVCNESKGEKRVRKFLDEIGVAYAEQVSFSELTGMGGGLLLFDFGILNGDRVSQLIEFDGIQHFKPIGKHNPEAVDSFERLREHDRRKGVFCAERGLPLLRISYLDFDKIDSLLGNFVCEKQYKGAA